MAVIVPCRGNNFKFTPNGSGSDAGFYRVEGLAANQKTNPILVVSVDSRDTDVVLPVVTLENTKILYSFGSNFGEISVNGMILLGKGGASTSVSLKLLVDFFEKNRVGNSKTNGGKSVTVSGPGTAWKVFLTGLAIQQADPQFNTQPFSLIGTVAQPK